MDEHDKAQAHEREQNERRERREQDRIDPDHDAPLDETADDGRDEKRDEDQREPRRRNIPRLVWIGLGLAATLIVIVFGLMTRAGDEAGAPSLEAQVRQQQQALDQLRTQLNELQQRDGEEDSEVREAVSGLDRRLDELSSSVDVRFSAAQEKQQALEKAIEEMRRLPDSTTAGEVGEGSGVESGSEPSLVSEPIRRLTRNLSAPKPDSEGEGASKPESTSKSGSEAGSEADTKPEEVAAESAPKPEPKPKPKRRYTPPSPPFTVSGLEIRGGNRFLAIMFGEGRRLSDLRLVGEGQSVRGWRLSSIYGHSATFIVNGKSVDVSIP